jgi:hypothetical protein
MIRTGGFFDNGGGLTSFPTASQGWVRFFPQVPGLAERRTTNVVSSAPSQL